tara:strand:+ start:107 stop:427 length:321 start_codon:yes stop_codon:yes gene_type:complete
MKKFVLIILLLNFLNSCGSVGEGFTLKKSNTGDEFLVEKKNPLVLPPNFNELPEPGKFDKIEEENQTSFEGKIINEDNQANKDSITSSAKSTEEFILRNIKINESN